ncbi:transcription initiation factor TFIID subunit 4b-like isoform X1 [Trifolium pratense]|nr:transcription initiation factor TFIID subunit 4b-like isoform X1 [Trifolium pratense]XP_045798375.1 transcription initiation factor TFIID subunit 4b-like isoform X1 [Trifolium pratense]XP_045798376.1 transcription initiation factor TFIID subunit 4b-like isoform X1 [Trifolium pratense]XP_045798377.1 transcription initiation factor TFIID subunit 4b-like isoform X1 [Trifolium pratense]XP_045798378.1 transcription initiation factor TFIID subunit 4b-like isoform X1 [Trifolium pratense]XP_0457983
MDPSIVKLLEDDEDETMHSGADVEAFEAALNRDIAGDASDSHLSHSDAGGSNNSFSQSLSTWPTSSHDNQIDSQNQEPKIAQQKDQPLSETEPNQQGPIMEQIQNSVASQDASNITLSHKQSQDNEVPKSEKDPIFNQHSHQHSQTNEVPKSEKDPIFNHEPIKTNNPNIESQYAKLQQMSNQQATVVSEQPSSQVNRSKQVPFGMLLPMLIPQLAKDRAMQLQTLFNKLKRDEIPKDHFVRLMKGIVGDQMLRMALAKVQQTKANTGSSGQQHPVRMPSVTSSGTKFNDPHALAQLHQRSMSAAPNHSHNTSPAIQVKSEPSYSTMDVSAKKPQEHDVRVVQPNQLQSSSSNAVSQETERSSVHIQGLNKQQQQHIHFPSTYGSSGGNYIPFSGTTTSSSSSLRPQIRPHDSHIRQISHQSIGLSQQSSFNDPKRMPGGSVSTVVNNTTSQQNLNSWQPSAEQNSGLFTSMSYVKKEPNDLSIEQQHRQHMSKLHGLPSVNSGQNEQGSGINQGTVKNEFSRGSVASTSMPHTTSASMPPNSASPSASQLAPTVSLSSQIPVSTSGISSKTPLKKTPIGQKKPLEALGSSPPPPSKKQKVSGSSLEQSIEQLNDVAAVSGVDLREEEEQLFSGPKEDSRVSEASRRVVQEEEENLILLKAPLQRKLIEIMTECGLKGMSNDVERCLSLCVEERMRGVISNIIRMSKQRVDIEKTRHRTVVTSDVRQQIMTMNKKAREEWEKKQAEADKLRKLNDVEGSSGVDSDKEKDDGRNNSTRVNREVDDKMRTNAANVAARAAVGGDDMLSKWQLMAEQARQKREGGTDTASGSQPTKDVSRKSSPSFGRYTKDNQERERKGPTFLGNSAAARKLGKNQSPGSQTRIARSISVKDVIAVLEREPQMSKSSLLYRLHERIHSDTSTE